MSSITPLFDKQDKFVLKDGRSIGYLIAGDENSDKTVVNSVANAACRFMAHTMSDKASGIRLIAVDRPGIGLSDPQKKPSLLGFANDVLELMDHFGVKEFSVLGESIGGPHALAIAHQAKEKVKAVGLLSSVGPPETYKRSELRKELRVGTFLAKRMPSVMGFLLKTGFSSKWKKARESEENLIEFEKSVVEQDYPDEADLDFMSEIPREAWISMGAGNLESFRQGPSGTLQHIALWDSPWEFELKDIEVPVYLHFGEEDGTLPQSMAEKMAKELPNSTLHFEKGAAHLSTIFNCMEQTLKDITSVSGN